MNELLHEARQTRDTGEAALVQASNWLLLSLRVMAEAGDAWAQRVLDDWARTALLQLAHSGPCTPVQH